MQKKNGFTLIEMLVVISIAMILLGIGATSFQKMKHSNSLSTASYTVQGALQNARAQAMKLNKVVRVYFLDGGQVKNTATPPALVNYDGSDAESYLWAISTYEVPYELMTVTADGKELGRDTLPEGYGWVSLGHGIATGFTPNYVADSANVNYPIDRNCSLIVNFSPSGTSWADAAAIRAGVTTTANDTTKNIRVFNIDELAGLNNSSGAIITTNMWALSGGKMQNVAKAAATNIFWHTVKMNYNTGLTSITHNQDE